VKHNRTPPSGEPVTAVGELLPNEQDLARFVAAVFKRADPKGIVSLRAFLDLKKDAPPRFVEPISIGDPQFLPVVIERARQAANWIEPVVFCPPVVTLRDGKNAKADNVLEGVALTVECDQGPSAAQAHLRETLGDPTVTVASGGEWTNPNTGEVEPKIHLHWRLNVPTRTPQEHANLREARDLAAKLVGADASAIPLVHPLRWPGSWHRKGAPRLAKIIFESENEIDLDEALDVLRDAAGAITLSREYAKAVGLVDDFKLFEDYGKRLTKRPLQATDPRDVAAALKVIPNKDLEWKPWNEIGLATWAASGGSEEGRAAFEEWSAKSSKNDPVATRARWDHYRDYPPTRSGIGKLIYLARKHDPLWTAPSWTVPAKGARNEAARKPSSKLSNDIVTEDSAAQQFVEQHGGRLRYCHTRDAWFHWNGVYWKQDGTGRAFHWARELARRLAEDQDGKTRYIASKTSFAAGVERFAKHDPKIAVTSDYWDRDPWLLGTPAGTVDLRTGALRPASPDDGITKTTAVTPSGGDCPQWLKFLNEATGEDKGLIRFLQQWCGYCLTGITREHALLFVYGDGGNGKGVYLNTFTSVLKDYAVTSAMETFTASNGDKHPTDLAMLCGARLVTASETEAGKAWAEARIKQMTGGDPITARFMRQDFFTYMPQFKLTIIGNHKPTLNNVDAAARRRFNIVPFTRKPSAPDRQLGEKLMAEAPAILQWMIEGCLDWQKNELIRAACVIEATEEYFSDQEVFPRWLEEECITHPGATISEASSVLYRSWSEYARSVGAKPGAQADFKESMRRAGFTYRQTNTARQFCGIQLKPKRRPDEDDVVAIMGEGQAQAPAPTSAQAAPVF
jgi:putative DNA primase/helicase